MVVMIVDNATPALRGKLSMWLMEIKAGVFVGHINAMVRDKLWDWVTKQKSLGGCILLYAANNEQHFCIRQSGKTSREVVLEEGLYLMAQNKE